MTESNMRCFAVPDRSRIISEGKVRKGGQNDPPKTKRPPFPQARVRTVSRRFTVYLCPTCKRRIRRVKAPKPCCGVRLVALGTVNETTNPAQTNGFSSPEG